MGDSAATTAGSVTDDRKGPRDRWVTKLSSVRDTGGRVSTLPIFVPRSGRRANRPRQWAKGLEDPRCSRCTGDEVRARNHPHTVVDVDIFVGSDPAGTVDVGVSGIVLRAQEKVLVAVASPRAVLQRKVVRVDGFQPSLKSGVMLFDRIAMFQGLVIREVTRMGSKKAHP